MTSVKGPDEEGLDAIGPRDILRKEISRCKIWFKVRRRATGTGRPSNFSQRGSAWAKKPVGAPPAKRPPDKFQKRGKRGCRKKLVWREKQKGPKTGNKEEGSAPVT